MPITNIPRYPVVDPDPSFALTFSSFRISDFAAVGVGAYSGYLLGWFGGEKRIRNCYQTLR